MENHTAKHFVLQLGSLASLYLSLSFLLVLLFGLINIAMPDAADSYWDIERAREGIKIGLAMTIVFLPAYLVLTRIVNNSRRQSPDHSYLGLTKWLIYLSLLVGGAVLLGDLVAVIMFYLEGDITTRFVLKAASVLVVVGAAFQYYLMDVKGYWLANESKSKMAGLAAGLVALAIVIAGFMNVESPKEARERNLDEQQVRDLQDIQWQVSDYLAINEELPESLTTLAEEQGVKVPSAPQGRADYRYEITEGGFTLCATFANESEDKDHYYGRPYIADSDKAVIQNPDNWQHGAGEHCFERVVK